MKCKEVKDLAGAYRDSELDARSTQEIQGHLAQCVECARFYRSELELDAALGKTLRQPSKTGSLWEAEEAFVNQSFKQRARESSMKPAPTDTLSSFIAFWREFLWPNPKYYLALAAVWILLLTSSSHPTTRTKAQARLPQQMQAQIQMVLAEQRREFRELLGISDATSQKSESNPLPPRSECQGMPKAT